MNNDKIKAVADIIENIHWELLDGGFEVYEVDEVAYWKPIKPPSEVYYENIYD